MKTKIAIVLAVIAAMLGLVGCKPKETTLSGQAFIVTQGADNVKLGDVEILLVEKPQVVDFLQKKQSAIEAEVQQKQQEVGKAQQKAEEASKNASQAQTYYDWFEANKPYKTNADYAKLKLQWNTLFNLYLNQSNYVVQLEAYATNHMDDENAFNNFFAVRNKREETAEKLNSLNDQLEAIKLATTEMESEKLSVAKSDLTEANANLAIAQTNLNNAPAIEDYLQDFSPVVVQKALSDADGKFTFTYPRDKTLTIFASAQRMLLNKKEKYFWLVDAPTNSDKAQIFLSNNNLVYVDPDGYFKIKPKEEIQESPEANAQ